MTSFPPLAVSAPLYGLTDAGDAARRLAEIGFDGTFTFEGPHDVFAPLTLAAAATELHCCSNIAVSLPRNPIHMAHTAWDLQVLTGGRFALGLGTQTRAHITRRFGVPFDRPVARMREQVSALRAIFGTWQDGSSLRFQGEFFRHTLMTPVFNPGPLPWGPPPIWVAALGPRMTEMAAGCADGVLVMPFNSHRHWQERTLPGIEAGLAAGGRERSAITVVAEAILAVGRDEVEQAAADEGARGLLAFYASTPAYRPVLEVEGWADAQPELNRLSKEGRWAEMPDLIDDTMLATLAVRGEPAAAAAELRHRFAGVADRLFVYAPYAVEDGTLADVVAAC